MSVSPPENNLWGIHAGSTGDAHTLFTKQNCIAIGWHEMGDLSKIQPTREAFKVAVAATFPHMKAGAIPTTAGQMFRFLYEMKVDDLVAYPSKHNRMINLGRITGEYVYDPASEATYPHRRAVTWLKHRPRTLFTQGALYEIGSALSLFLLKNYADEFRAATSGAPLPAPSVTEDETVAAVAADIEETTRDYVLKRLAQQLKGHPFADFVAHLLNTMGYRTRVSPPGPDGGVDIVAHKDELGFEPPIIKVQVKSKEGSVGQPEVSSLIGTLGQGENGLLVTLGTFTGQATNFARSKSNLRLIDGLELVKLVFEHYDQFDSRYKGLLPLRRVYVPEAIDADGE
jgi:restriction system protein